MFSLENEAASFEIVFVISSRINKPLPSSYQETCDSATPPSPSSYFKPFYYIQNSNLILIFRDVFLFLS